MSKEKLVWFVKRIIVPAAALLAYAALAYGFVKTTPIYNPYGSAAGGEVAFEKATVISIESQNAEEAGFSGLYTGGQTLTVRMDSGEYKGQEFQITNSLNYSTNYLLQKGEHIIVSVNTSTGDRSYVNVYMFAPQRSVMIFVLIGLFVLALCVVGGKKGLYSVMGIFFTLTTVFFVFIPALMRGVQPLAAVLILVAVTSCVTIFLISGVNAKSVSAISGAIFGVGFSIVIMLIFASIFRISGYTMSSSDALLNIAGQTPLKVKDLLYVCIIIASLGAVMDIAISISAAMSEFMSINPQSTFKALFSSGLNVGKEMMGTMVNTLILAFIGANIVSFILTASYQINLTQLFNSNDTAEQILESVCGGMAVILTVPLVALISAKLLTFKKTESQ
jgi:uncharacterized membrane protein